MRLKLAKMTPLCFLWVMASVVFAAELEQDWYTAEINTPDHWSSAIHANAGVDCHGCHVESPNAQKKTVIWQKKQPVTVTLLSRSEYDARCQTCHANSLKSFEQTFHGKHALLGKTNVPTCSFCHAGHEQPLASESNPLHVNNIGLVCAGCHSDSNNEIKTAIKQNIDSASTLRMHSKPDSVPLLGIELSTLIDGFYTLLLITVLGFFTVYFILDLPKVLQAPAKNNIDKSTMSKPMKWFHLVFSIAFVVLAITGFAIKYPDSTFSQIVMVIIGNPDIRSMVHRIAAIAFAGSAYFFFLYAIIKRFNIKDIVPNLGDLKSIKQDLSVRLGRSAYNHQPRTGVKSWISKFEIWASIIGLHIVLITGLVMWFMEWTLANMSYSLFKYAQQIHGWEAILAVSTILLVHGYWVVVRPLLGRNKESNAEVSK